MTITVKAYISKTQDFSPSLASEIINGIHNLDSPAVFWTGDQFLWLSELWNGYRITSGNPQFHSGNVEGFFIRDLDTRITEQELQDFFSSIIPKGSIVTYPVFDKLDLPLDPEAGDSDKKVNIYKDDILVAIYYHKYCNSGIKKDEMEKLLPQIFSDPEYVKVQEIPDAIFPTDFISNSEIIPSINPDYTTAPLRQLQSIPKY